MKTKVITFASLVTSRPIITKNPFDDWVIYDFEELYQYKKSCFSCPSLLPEALSYYSGIVANGLFKFPLSAIIAKQFWDVENTIIHQYKTGSLPTKKNETQTESFTSHLMANFPFLEKERDSLIPDNVKMLLWTERHKYLATKDLQDLSQFTHKKVAEGLLQKAWCSQVFITEDNWSKIDYLLNSGDNLIFISDINPLHTHYLMTLLQERYPQIKFAEVISGSQTPLPKKLTTTISWASSYDYHCYSSEYNNRKFKVAGPTIMAQLVEQLGAENLEFISHFDFNRNEATKLGVHSKQLEEFFHPKIDLADKKYQ